MILEEFTFRYDPTLPWKEVILKLVLTVNSALRRVWIIRRIESFNSWNATLINPNITSEANSMDHFLCGSTVKMRT